MKDFIPVLIFVIFWVLTSLIGNYIAYTIMVKKDKELNSRLYNNENTIDTKTTR